MSEQIREAITRKAILRKKTVLSLCGLSNSGLYDAIKRGVFPPPIRLCESGRAVGWIEEEVQQWIENRIEASRPNAAVGE